MNETNQMEDGGSMDLPDVEDRVMTDSDHITTASVVLGEMEDAVEMVIDAEDEDVQESLLRLTRMNVSKFKKMVEFHLSSVGDPYRAESVNETWEQTHELIDELDELTEEIRDDD